MLPEELVVVPDEELDVLLPEVRAVLELESVLLPDERVLPVEVAGAE